MSRAVVLLAVAITLSLAACGRLAMSQDGTSVSFGPANDGALLDPAELPIEGDGYWMPPIWARRGIRYGTDELVAFVVHLGRSIAAARLARPLAVADLSPQRGGPSAWHRSHQTGRDVDLVFFARDAAGQPVAADRMRRFGADGVSLPAKGEAAEAPVHFDDRANWILVRAILENPVAEVEYIFISDDLKQRVIDVAVAAREPGELIAAAGYLLHQPSSALPHDDHMHVRVYCAPADLSLGCREIGTPRWHKKGVKYRAGRPRSSPALRWASAALRSRPLLLTALPALPFRGFVPR